MLKIGDKIKLKKRKDLTMILTIFKKNIRAFVNKKEG